jgi:thiol-disulfide isomerase/thioredoxin
MQKIIFFLVLVALGCKSQEDKVVGNSETEIAIEEIEIPCGYEIGDVACNFTLEDARGDEVSLNDLKGDIVVLDFSTAWCYYCQMAALDAQAVQDTYEHQGFTYVTVIVEGFDRLPPSQDLLLEWETHFEITTSPVLSGDSTLIDVESQTGWKVEAWPTFYYLDRDLKIVEYQKGWSQSLINATIESLLSQ